MPPIIFNLGGPHLNLNPVGRRGVPPNLVGTFLLPRVGVTITGVSRDSTGVALAGCTCILFKVTQSPNPVTAAQTGATTFTQMATTVSDGSGNYSFNVGFDGPYRVTFDLDGAPIRAGITLKTLSGV